MNQLLDLRPKQWHLVIAPPRTRMLIAIAALAHNSELIVLDCGRQFDSSIVARAAGGRQEIIDRIQIQRAFTCYEAVKLIEQLPVRNIPVLILDFLSTFQDENIKIQSRRFLLERSIQHFQRLGHGAGLAVSINAPPASLDSLHLVERLRSAAQCISNYQPIEDQAAQMRLF